MLLATALGGPVVSAGEAAVSPARVGVWRMDEGAGRTVADSGTFDNDLTLSRSTGWTEGLHGTAALAFDDRRDVARTDDAIVRTDRAFAVLAIVRPDSLARRGTSVSLAGRGASALSLGLAADDRRCPDAAGVGGCFQVWTTADRSGGAGARVSSPRAVELGAWVMLAAIYDPAAPPGDELRLATCDGTGPELVESTTARLDDLWRARGPVEVGRERRDGRPANGWRGELETVVVLDGAIDDATVAELCLGPITSAAAGAAAQK